MLTKDTELFLYQKLNLGHLCENQESLMRPITSDWVTCFLSHRRQKLDISLPLADCFRWRFRPSSTITKQLFFKGMVAASRALKPNPKRLWLVFKMYKQARVFFLLFQNDNKLSLVARGQAKHVKVK